MSGPEIAAEVAAALAEAGVEVGSGPHVVSLEKPGAPSGPEWDRTPGAPFAHDLTVIEDSVGVGDGNGSLVARAARTLLVAVADAEPEETDTILIDGARMKIAAVRPLAPAGVVLLWEVDLIG